MALVAGSRAELTVGVNGAPETERRIESVADALRRLNGASLQGLGGQLGGMTDRISTLQSKIGAFAAYSIAGFSLAALVSKVGDAVGALGDLDDMAQKTGSSVETLSRLSKVAAMTGADFGAVDAALVKLSKNLTEVDDKGSNTAKALAAIGISAEDIKGKDPAQVFVMIANKMQDYEDGAGKVANVTDLMGKSAAGLLPYMNDVAESLDQFTGDSTSAAAAAAKLQDDLGALKVKCSELATSIATDALPAANDFIGAIKDIARESDNLTNNTSVTTWADDVALVLARMADGGILVARTFGAVSASVKATAANIEFMNAVSENVNPVGAAKVLLNGGSPNDNIKAALNKRNGIVAQANQDISVLWTKPLDAMEQAMQSRIAGRFDKSLADGADALAGMVPAKPEQKKDLNYRSGKDSGAAEIEKEAGAYAGLISAIRAKTEENKREVEIDAQLTESQKTRIKLDEDIKSGKLKLSSAHRVAIAAALEEQAASEKTRKEQLAQTDVTRFIAASTVARTQSTASLGVEYQMYGKSADARELAMVGVRAEADMEKQLTAMRQAGQPVTTQMLAQLEAEKSARTLVEQATLGQSKALAYASQLAEENRRAEAEGIADPQQRAQAMLAIDAGVWQERIRLAGEGTDAQKRLQSEYGTWYARHSKESFAEVDLARATQMLQVMESLDDAARQAASGMEQSFGGVGKAIGGLTTALTGYSRTQAAVAAQLAGATKAANGDPGKIAKANAEASKQAAQAQIQSYGDMAGAAKGFFDEHSHGFAAMEAAEKTFRAFEIALAIKTMLEKSGIVQTFTGLFVAGKAAETTATVASVAPDVTASMVKGQAAAAAGVAGQAQGDPYSAWARMAAMAAVMAGLGFAVGGVGGKKDTTAVDRQRATGTGTVFGDADAKSESIAKAIELSAANSNIELNYTAGMLRSLRAIESSLSGLGGILAQNGLARSAPGSNYGGAGATNKKAIMGVATVSDFIMMGGLGTIVDKLTGGFVGKITGQISNAIFGGKTKGVDVGVTANSATVGQIRNGGLNAQQYTDMTKDGGVFHSDKEWTDMKDLGDEASHQFSLVLTGITDSIDQAARLIGVGGDQFSQWLNGFTVNLGKISSKDLTAEEFQKQLEAQFSMIGDSMASQAVQGLLKYAQVGEGYLETLVRVANNYANLDAILASTGDTFGATGMSSIAARENLIELAGGIDELASKTAGFAENFLTEAERLAPVQKYVTDQLAAMGLAGLRSREAYKQYVLGLDLTNEAQRQQYVALMDLQEAYAKVYPEIMATTLTLADAKSALADAYNAEVDAIGATIDRMASFAATLRSVRDSALLGNLSPLSPQEKYAEAKAQYQAVLSAARGGDEGAQSNYQGAFTSFLEASRTVFASSSQYQTDFAYAQTATEEAARWAEAQVDVGQAQLDVLKSQVSGIIEINKSVLSVRDALLQYREAISGNTMPLTGYAPPPVGPIPYSSYGTSNTEALVAEVKALRAEVSGLRADARQQTGDQITSNVVATEASSQRVSSAVKMAMLQATANERVSPE
jgi:hypothetical protein